MRGMKGILVATALAAGLSAAPAKAEEIKIGVVNLSLCCAYFIGMDAAIKAEASFYPNITVISSDANGDVAKLTSDVEDMLTQGVDGIILSGAWIEAAPEATDAITAAGTPLVLVDRMLKPAEFTSWIGPDNRAIGEAVGGYVAGKLGGSGHVVLLRGGPADNSIGIARTEGFIAGLGEGYTVDKAPDFGGWSSDGGFKLMEQMLAQYEDIDAVFCENDSMCLGAQKAIADAGKSGDIILAGVDGEKAALTAIMAENSNYVATGLNSSDQIGRAAFHRLIAILAGAEAPKETALPSPLINAENVVRFYNPESVF